MLYLAATLSEVCPIPTKQSLACLLDMIYAVSSPGLTGATKLSAYKVIFSTPEAIPISIIPDLILAAMIELASNPEEQNLLMTFIGTVSGIPAKNCPILAVRQPAPIYKTFPTTISSIFFGSTPDLFINPLKTV